MILITTTDFSDEKPTDYFDFQGRNAGEFAHSPSFGEAGQRQEAGEGQELTKKAQAFHKTCA
jgi:hypothetical protein